MAAADGDSFLPRIQSVFYAVFDVRQGPKIVYQVPEGLISSSPGLVSGGTSLSNSPIPTTPSTERSASSSRASSISITSPMVHRPESRLKYSPQKRSLSSSRILFNFDDISKYIIPPSALCGRLVICATRKYRIVGFPSELRGKYERNYFRFNLCFVFDRSADLSCYEPVVRKVNRVLTACEEESCFLSSPESSPKMHAILEQLYEDLNSYSETSIFMDKFNSIELKIFPFYPNPPPVKDWMVPLALIDLEKVIEPNWDLTMAKVCQYIDGTNHVSRIAHLADCDIELTRQAISHLLYYQVIMTIDIFQYSNSYTLRKSIEWLANESHVREECGSYVVKPGRMITDWPKLLYLYSRLKPGKTVFEWMQEQDVRNLGIDVRRFTSFGVIKVSDAVPIMDNIQIVGLFCRLTLNHHRNKKKSPSPPSPSNRRRSTSLTTPIVPPNAPLVSSQARSRRRTSDTSAALISVTSDPPALVRGSSTSAAEQSLEQLQIRNNSRQPTPSSPHLGTAPLTSRAARGHKSRGPGAEGSEGRRRSVVSPVFQFEVSQVLTITNNGSPERRLNSFATLPVRPRLSRSPSSPAIGTQQQSAVPLPVTYPPELVPLLDGEHHTDELCTRFEVGWPTMEEWLVAIGEGKGDGDFGKVLIIYR
ncbi:hypothetical protein EW146_g7616 [Bondarzewia mesenterica]|uniref:Nitrogen permease regulator 2 n=1 Tax=Bondarzewia mesenterica TaxID=1095465 RepID=A0A4S4LM26_9AGAM|nr:hypothetical protein EW146_g7616 [Bondarzewia mesenterica]